MGIISSDSDRTKEKEQKKESINWTEIVSGEDDILFSCSSAQSRKNKRELFVTENRVVIYSESEGRSFPIESSVISFGERSDSFRITVSSGSRGYGIRVSKDNFRGFWKVFTSVRDD